MKTLSKTIPCLFHVQTPDGGADPPVPPGNVRLHFVQFETVEMPLAEFEGMTFHMLDLSSPHVETLGRLIAKP